MQRNKTNILYKLTKFRLPDLAQERPVGLGSWAVGQQAARIRKLATWALKPEPKAI